MRPTVLILLLLASGSQSSVAQSFRIATFNLNWGNRRGDLVLAAIRSAKPDLLCLQETTAGSEPFLRKHLAQNLPAFSAVGHQGHYAAERFAIASKQPPMRVRFHEPSGGLFGFYVANVKLLDRDVKIINIHLTPFQIGKDAGLADAMRAVRSLEEKHAVEIRAILKQIDATKPTIVLGDFNSLSSFVAPRELAERGLIDSYASIHQNADQDPTWSWAIAGALPLKLRIDYIFHTAHFQTTRSQIIRNTGSDHDLLVSELKFLRQSSN